VVWGKADFASNQLLIMSNLKSLNPSTEISSPIITTSNVYKSLFPVIKVDLQYPDFICAEDALNLGDLLILVNGVTLIEVS
jgi:hypothetical protein